MLNIEEAAIPVWETQLRATSEPQKRITAEAKLLRQCSQWIKQLENGQEEIINLRLDTDLETEYVRFDRLRVSRILERIAADLDQLAEGADTSR